MNIKILCPESADCSDYYETIKRIKEVAVERNITISFEVVEDMEAIRLYSVVGTPAILIDGKIAHLGGVPARKKVEAWFAQSLR